MAKKQANLLSLWSRKATEEDGYLTPEEEMFDEPRNDIDQSLSSEILASGCSAQCCTDEGKAFQPTDRPTLQLMKSKTRNFQAGWYKQFPWISVCVTRKKIFCLYCRCAHKRDWFTFSRCGENVFTEVGFQNWKKRCREV